MVASNSYYNYNTHVVMRFKNIQLPMGKKYTSIIYIYIYENKHNFSLCKKAIGIS